MSFLDRLKREADQQRLQAEAVARERDERETLYRTQIEPRMKALVTYLEGLAATLLEVKPPIAVTMPIQGYGDIVAKPFWDYKVEHERRHRSFVISMTWTQRVDAERSPTVRADNVTRVRALTNLFRQYLLGGIKEERRSPQGELVVATFNARGHLKAQMQAQISTDDPVLRLMFENASWLGVSRRQVPWNQIDDGLFDRIARFVVREDDSLFTEEVPEELRQRLRKDPDTGAPAPMEAPAPAAPVAAPTPAITKPIAPIAGPAVAAPRTPAPLANDALNAVVNAGYKPGSAPPPSTMLQGETIQIDESKLGLSGDMDMSMTGISRGSAIAAPPVVPAARPLMEGDVIPIDESKLGLSNAPMLREGDVIEIDESKLGLADLTDAGDANSAFTPARAPQSRAPAPLGDRAATPPAAATPTPTRTVATTPQPAAPAASPAAVRTAAPPSSTPQPVAPAAPRTAATPPNATQPAAPPVATAAQRPAPTAAVQQSPAATHPTAPPVAAQPNAAASATPQSPEDKEREAALFRLRLRATLARLKDDEVPK